MKLILNHDDSGTGFPAPEQIEVGELKINSVTGKLYTKLVNGSVVEFLSQYVCFDPVPEVTLYYDNMIVANNDINNYCCVGGLLEFNVSKLKLDPNKYEFKLIELTNNSNLEDIEIAEPVYTNYTTTMPNSTTSITLRRAVVPVRLAITNNTTNISLFKFSIFSITDNKTLLESIVTIKCS